MKIGPPGDHRNREGGALIYPVYSRRSGGLSVGINLFPGRKICSFDCPYCEVFPFEENAVFDLGTMKTGLCSCLDSAVEQGLPIRDICFSGSGEPSMSPHFVEALEAARRIRDERAGQSKLVLITNGTGLLNPALFEFLKTRAERGLRIWIKLDGATESWYKIINRPDIVHGNLVSCIRDFALSGAPFTLQTMVCRVKGALPPPEEEDTWIALVTELAEMGRKGEKGGLEAVQIYGKARPAPEDPLAEAAEGAVLEKRAERLRAALKEKGLALTVEVFP
ncbi:MAG: hypothetical protein LBD31_00750 [Treponema sp.]|nr:hypothetical protein [Treponema sp.]